ncbi:hypothetical protein NIBR502772_07360 [Pseudarthrobacter sp. NIBRBAC000502772]|uniref:PH domain-containing protein n=1 Tax=Pseudarthrobacter sp. NIBRBAC000502772 TaxID=2590775 RepID=UPI00113083B1|nr:PH domain-containing protein [Pseudarthrobacter sp. NIBRBAC000502772]QDG66058.1 hypothetical protein NIBR502772_07360 [Pseudarthrobacter sp. NIBRBAC000502772]
MAVDQLRDDIQQAKDKAGITWGSNREFRKLESHLWEGERVEQILTGQYAGGLGILVLSDRRIFFLKDGVMKQVSEDFPFSKISSMQWNSGLALGAVTVFVSGNKAEITNVAKQLGKAFVDAARDRIAPSAPRASESQVAAHPAVQETEDVYANLAKIGQLRDAGVLTPEEFETKKAELLARI